MAKKIKAPAAIIEVATPATPAPELQVELENALQVQTAPVAKQPALKEYTATKDIEADINNHKIKCKAGDKVQLKSDEAFVLKAYIKN